MAFDSTLMGNQSNSYVSVAQADEYFDLNYNKEKWDDLSSDEKEQFLVSATTRINMEKFGGEPTDSTQRLQFPRKWVQSRNVPSNDVILFNGVYYLNPEINPTELETATYELAMFLIEEYRLEEPLFSRQDIDRMETVAIGPLQATLRKTKEHALPDMVSKLLSLVGWMGSSNMKLVR